MMTFKECSKEYPYVMLNTELKRQNMSCHVTGLLGGHQIIYGAS